MKENDPMEQDKRCLAVFEAQSEGYDDAPSYLSLQLSQNDEPDDSPRG